MRTGTWAWKSAQNIAQIMQNMQDAIWAFELEIKPDDFKLLIDHEWNGRTVIESEKSILRDEGRHF